MSPRMDNNNNNFHINQNDISSQNLAEMNNDSDDDDDDSDSDLDSDEENELYINPDEPKRTRYNVVLCELYNKYYGNDKNLCYYYLNIYSLKSLNMYLINKLSKIHITHYNSISNLKSLSVIKNYANIVKNDNYIKPQIAENIVLGSGHTICIIKTIWIKLIQRTWKKIYALRKDTIKKRCKIESLTFREINGRWPNDCIYFPRLNGMISSLKKY
jgi:hypothetical protein